jgi:hypothetical protein
MVSAPVMMSLSIPEQIYFRERPGKRVGRVSQPEECCPWRRSASTALAGLWRMSALLLVTTSGCKILASDCPIEFGGPWKQVPEHHGPRIRLALNSSFAFRAVAQCAAHTCSANCRVDGTLSCNSGFALCLLSPILFEQAQQRHGDFGITWEVEDVDTAR